jgi:hypothetical protein
MQLEAPVIAHLEKFCGPIERGWQCDADGNKMPFQIVQMQGGPISGTTTFSTLGLGKIPLTSRTSQKIIWHELVMLSRSNATPANLPPLLQQVAAEAVHRNYAYPRGDVIGPRGPLFQDSTVTGLYVSAPAYFPKEFSSVEDDVGTVIFAWLFPITNQEANLIREVGWDGFEARLEVQDPDLLDFKRASLPPS